MNLAKIIAYILRLLQFAFSVVILAICAELIHRNNNGGNGPRGRYIYTEIIAAFSTLYCLINIVPQTWRLLHYPIDFFLMVCWYSSFGAVYEWIHNGPSKCAGLWVFNDETHGAYCERYRVMEGFTFTVATLFLFSGILSVYIFHRVRKQVVTTTTTTTAPETAAVAAA